MKVGIFLRCLGHPHIFCLWSGHTQLHSKVLPLISALPDCLDMASMQSLSLLASSPLSYSPLNLVYRVSPSSSSSFSSSQHRMLYCNAALKRTPLGAQGARHITNVSRCPNSRSREGNPFRCTSSASDGPAASSYIPELADTTKGNKTENKWNPGVLVAIAAVIVAAGLAVSIFFKRGYLLNSSRGEASQLITDLSTSVTSSEAPAQFTVVWFGRKFSLVERSPGWVYFLLLMAAGFGLFVSEEALNVWVGGTLGRCLTWDKTTEALMSSLSANASYIASTILWVYWGVCISDMVPFYAGRLAAKSGTANRIHEKLGVSQEKFDKVKSTVQKYGNLIGFVERFSIGVRNPTSFLAGFVGIKPSRYFAGVLVGSLITLPLQMGVGVVLRDRPVASLAGVAAAVGIWTILPYAAAGMASAVYVLRQRHSKQSS